jgi:hypothetical protein
LLFQTKDPLPFDRLNTTAIVVYVEASNNRERMHSALMTTIRIMSKKDQGLRTKD